MSGRRRWLAAAAGALVLAATGSAAAVPAGPVQVAIGGAAFTDRPAGPLMQVDALVPGASATVVFGVRTTLPAQQALSLRLLPAGDAGDLARELGFTVAVGTGPAGPFRTVWHGSAALLRSGVSTGAGVAAGGDRWVRLTAAVPPWAGNEIAGDAYRFGLRVQLTGPGHGVDGVSIGAGRGAGYGVAGERAGPVSHTGTALAALCLTAGLLGAAGALLLVAARRRRSRPAP